MIAKPAPKGPPARSANKRRRDWKRGPLAKHSLSAGKVSAVKPAAEKAPQK